MVSKKCMFLFIIFWGIFLLSSSHLYAGEAELINLLKKKGIITQQEAEQLLQEVRSETQKEREDAKKSITTEIKADIKKDADKGEFMPKALKGFKFGAQIFTEWNAVNRFDGYAPTSTTAPGKNSNAFVLNRGQFTLSKDINDWLGMNITADLFYSTDIQGTTNDATNGAELRLKAAYANMKFYGTDTMVGMVPTPSDGYDNSIWAYRVQGKNLLDDLGILSTYDTGIANQGVFGGYMDDEYLKFASKPFAGKWGGYMIGLYNGSGFTTTTGEGNQNKVVSGLIYFRPFPTVSVLKGLQLAYFGAYGNSNKRSTVPGQTSQYPTFEVNMGQVSLLHSYFGIMGQYYWGQGAATGTEDNKRVGYLAEGYVRLPGVEKFRAFGKLYSYDPDTNRDNNDYKIFVYGLSYDVTPELMPFVALERRYNQNNVAPGTTAANIDYSKYQIGVQVKF
jgi:hypothetical protein